MPLLGSKDMGPCPVGHYCPDPATKIECLAGYFCPLKSAEPLVKCDGCGAGTTEMMGTDWHAAIIAPVAAAFVAVMIYYARKSRTAKEREDLERLENRLADNSECEQQMAEKQEEELERIRPLLEKIATNVEDLIEKEPDTYIVESSRKIFNHAREWLVNELDPGKLFSFVDVDFVGDISYDNLNKIMQINDVKFTAFTVNMNLLRGVPEQEQNISKEDFEEFFFEALVRSDNYGPTPSQVGQLYDELCGTSSVDLEDHMHAFNESDFFKSRLQDFLSDFQINELLSQLRFTAQMRGSGSARRRRSSLNMTSMAPVSSQTATINISKKLFMEIYPIVLNEITYGQYAAPGRNDISKNQIIRDNSIDIAFKNFSLDVHLAKKDIRILDNLTGRIKAGTMTALM